VVKNSFSRHPQRFQLFLDPEWIEGRDDESEADIVFMSTGRNLWHLEYFAGW
jgi:hypothetical protein